MSAKRLCLNVFGIFCAFFAAFSFAAVSSRPDKADPRLDKRTESTVSISNMRYNDPRVRALVGNNPNDVAIGRGGVCKADGSFAKTTERAPHECHVFRNLVSNIEYIVVYTRDNRGKLHPIHAFYMKGDTRVRHQFAGGDDTASQQHRPGGSNSVGNVRPVSETEKAFNKFIRELRK